MAEPCEEVCFNRSARSTSAPRIGISCPARFSDYGRRRCRLCKMSTNIAAAAYAGQPIHERRPSSSPNSPSSSRVASGSSAMRVGHYNAVWCPPYPESPFRNRRTNQARRTARRRTAHRCVQRTGVQRRRARYRRQTQRRSSLRGRRRRPRRPCRSRSETPACDASSRV